jgi:hypothetical protein
MKSLDNYTARANSVGEKLRDHWRDVLTEDERDEWRNEFLKADTDESKEKKGKPRIQADLREWIEAKCHLKLKFDMQVTRFRKWVAEQDQKAALAETMREDELAIQKAHPDWTLDQVRDEVLRRAYEHALRNADFRMGMQLVRIHTFVKKYFLDLEKFKFDAIARCRQQLPALKAIESNKSLTEAQKTQLWMERLFGKKPENLLP